MAPYRRDPSGAQKGQQGNRSGAPGRIPNHIRPRPRLRPLKQGLNAPSMHNAGHSPARPIMAASREAAPHESVSQDTSRQPFTKPCQALFDRSHDWEVNRRSESLLMHRQPEQRRRLSTPASDEITWGSDPSPMLGEPVGPRPGFARTLDVMENFLPAQLPESRMRDRSGTVETPLEDRPMETCESEGRDPLLALQAQKAEYIATEGRRLSELVQAHDRIRELEEELETNSSHDQALKVQFWKQDHVMDFQVQLIRELDRRNEQQERVIEQQAGQIRALQARMPKPAAVRTVTTAVQSPRPRRFQRIHKNRTG
ncbi:MAG: hypothetical protein Q9223_003917 [Gallowayella weberi]